jgi:hypothetical protein
MWPSRTTSVYYDLASRKENVSWFAFEMDYRLQWLAYLEFSHSRQEVHELSWDSIPEKLPLTQKLWEMMTTNAGIPHSLRPQLYAQIIM